MMSHSFKLTVVLYNDITALRNIIDVRLQNQWLYTDQLNYASLKKG